MRLKDVKEQMFIPEFEILINKSVEIRGINVYIIALTKNKGKHSLWVMMDNVFYEDDEYDDECEVYSSNREILRRDEIKRRIHKNSKSKNISISSMTIQNQQMNFSSSTGSTFGYENYDSYMKLQHFVEKGIDSPIWEDINLRNVCLMEFQQSDDENFPEIDITKNLDIRVHISAEFLQVPLKPPIEPLSMEVDCVYENNKISFCDADGQLKSIFVNELKRYDLWADTYNKIENEWPKILSKEELNGMKEDLFEAMEGICPSGMDLAILEYESEEDIQVNFYDKDYLDGGDTYRRSSSGIILKPDTNKGINGYRNRLCMIKPIDKGCKGPVTIEAVSWYKIIDNEIITIH